MASPIYTEEDVLCLLRCRKRMVEADVDQMPMRNPTSLEESKYAATLIVDDLPGIELIKMRAEQTLIGMTESYSVSLVAKLKNRPSQPFVRYDMHSGDHGYPNGLKLEPYDPHRHVYCSEMVVAGELSDWDKNPEIVDIGPGGEFDQRRRRLLWKMMNDLNIDTGSQTLLWTQL